MKAAFIHANVIDVLERKTLIDQTVLIEEGRICAVDPQLDTAGYQIEDLGGKYLSPGFFNMHVHTTVSASTDSNFHAYTPVESTLLSLENLSSYIRSGITFVRDVGSYDEIWEIREAVRSGRIAMAPDMQLSGRPICQTGGTTWTMVGYQADGEDECRKAARLMLRSGADWIKLMGTGGIITRGSNPNATQLSVEELRAASEEAHKLGLKSCCHVQNDADARNAILAGVDCLEHGDILSDETIQMMVNRGVWLDPTLSAAYCIFNRAPEGEFKTKAEKGFKTSLDSFKRAYAAGVPCVLANDCGAQFCYHDEFALELEMAANYCGVNPYEAFAMATVNAAALCGVEKDLGSVTVGKKAHFAVFAQDPIADIKAAQDCCMTVKNGQILWKK